MMVGMDYSAHYSRLIEHARDRVVSGYSERHHIVPRCMGGSNDPDNLVKLTAREHFVAHQLLCKIHPGVGKLFHAAAFMSKGQVTATSRLYAWFRERHATLVGNRLRESFNQPGVREAYSVRQRDRLLSDPDYKARLLAGSNQPDARRRAAESLRKHLATPAGKEKMRAAAIEKGSRPEQKKLRSEGMRLRHASGDPSLVVARENAKSVLAKAKRVASFKDTLSTAEAKANFSDAAKVRWETRDKKAAAEVLKRTLAGKENGRSRPVVQLLPNGFIVNEFPNMKAAALANGHDKHTIYGRVKRGHPLWVGV